MNDQQSSLLPTLVGGLVAMVGASLVFGDVSDSANTSAFERAIDQQTQLLTEMAELIVPLLGVVLALPIVAGLLLVVADKGQTVVAAVADRKQYPIATTQFDARWVARERADWVDCLICDLEEPGYRARFGREDVLLGFVFRRRVEGTNPVCVSCQQAGPDRWLRAAQDDPVSVVEELDLSPDEAHEAVEEVGAA